MSAEIADRVARLCALHGLPTDAERKLLSILATLESNALAPTTVRESSSAVDVHLADSLAALQLEEVRSASSIVDVGSGAGFPGMPLAIALPKARIALLESIARKCAFLESVGRAADVPNARVVCDRAETWAEGIGAHDLVTARALAAPATVLEYAAPLLRLGGSLVDWRGRLDERAERTATAAAAALGMERVAIQRVQPFAEAREHRLHVYRKVGETPVGFPRRAGMARKRPLGS